MQKGGYMKGVRFGNYHSYDSFNLILSQKTIGTPLPKTETIDIPGSDGVLDLTDFFGEVKYNNRELSFEFSTIVPQGAFMDLFSSVQNALHGKKMKISWDDDPFHYYMGRITVSEWKANKSIGKLTIDCDCEPYKYDVSETVVSQYVDGTGTFYLENDKKRVVPTITASSEMLFKYEGTYYNPGIIGTFTLPEIELKEGTNIVEVTGVGSVSFSYRKGKL